MTSRHLFDADELPWGGFARVSACLQYCGFVCGFVGELVVGRGSVLRRWWPMGDGTGISVSPISAEWLESHERHAATRGDDA
jgi:hypothetical protein